MINFTGGVTSVNKQTGDLQFSRQSVFIGVSPGYHSVTVVKVTDVSLETAVYFFRVQVMGNGGGSLLRNIRNS